MHFILKSFYIVLCSSVPFLFLLNGDFVFDDSEAILKNRDLNLSESFWNTFQHDFWGTDIKSKRSHKSYRPVTILTFRLNKQLDGDILVPYSFKLTNVILHTLATLLFYRFVNSAYQYQINITTSRFKIWQDVPFLSSVLFGVHPVHVEAVSGIVGRADVLSAIFFFLSLYFYEKCICIKRTFLNIAFFILSMFLAVLATLSKETGITVLCICSFYDVMIIHRLEFMLLIKYCSLKAKSIIIGNKKNSSEITISVQNYSGIITRQILLLITIFIILYGRCAIMNYEGPTFQNIDNPAAFCESRLSRILTYNYVYFINFLILLWPQWLCFDWSMGCIPILSGLYDIRIIFPALFWLFFFILIINMFSNWFNDPQKRMQSLALSLIIIPFLPASNIVLPVGFVIAERILYIPSAGFCILVAVGFKRLLTRSKSKHRPIYKTCFMALICILLLRTYRRGSEWLTEKSLYTSGLDVCPLNAKVHYNIAKNAGDSNNISLAESGYIEAIRLNPTYYQAMNNLANLLKDQNRFREAEIHLRNALKIKSDFPAAWMNLGIVLAALKKLNESENAYREALKYRKNYADCHYNLGNLYLDQKKDKLALESWFAAIKINPKHIVAWSNIFALLDNTEQIDRALKLIPEVLSVLLNVPAIHFNIANVLGKKGNFSEAEKHFKEAISLKEKDAPAVYYANLGVLYHRWKKHDLAMAMYKKALSVNPSLKSAIDNMKKLTNKK